jgi:hypothetical protein
VFPSCNGLGNRLVEGEGLGQVGLVGEGAHLPVAQQQPAQQQGYDQPGRFLA